MVTYCGVCTGSSCAMNICDPIFSAVYYLNGTLAICLNTLLLALVFTRSPKSLATYRVLLGNSAIADLALSVSMTLLQCRLIPNKWAFAYIALGPTRLLGEQASYIMYCIQLHALFYIFLCFPLSFGFRYYVLVRPTPTPKQTFLVLFCLWLIPLGQLILFINSESDPKRIREYLELNKPTYNLTGYVITGNNMQWQPLTVVTLATIVLPMFPIYVLVIYFYRKVCHFLDESRGSLVFQESTKKGHQSLIKALVLQASLPICFVFPPITIYGLYHLEFINLTIIEYLVYAIFSFLPVASPLCSLFFVRPYKAALLQLLGRHCPPGLISRTPLTTTSIATNRPMASHYPSQMV